MNNSEIRKIQLTGGSTFTVSLPKNWAKDNGLKAGSQVAIKYQPDMSLLITPKVELEPKEARETVLEVTGKLSPKAVISEFIATYLVGYNVIRVRFHPQTTKHRIALKEAIKRKLMGVEIIEESTSEMTAQCLLGYKELSADRALSRMSTLTSSMHKDAVSALVNCDLESAKEVVERDDEIDRFYFFIVRMLKEAVFNRAMAEEIGLTGPRDYLGYRLMVKSIERVADHSARIAYTALTIKCPLNKNVIKEISHMSALSQEVYQNAIKALYRSDINLAHDTIAKIKEVSALEEKIIKILLNLKLTNDIVIKLRIILESIRRIAEYGTDIAETVLNLFIEKELKQENQMLSSPE